MQRVVRKLSSIGRIKFNDVLVLGNAATMTLSLDAVVVDMSALKDVNELPSGFMSGCTSLTSITLPPNVEVLGERALGGCSSLVSLDMSALKNMKTLPDDFMCDCASLTSITLPPQVTDTKLLNRPRIVSCVERLPIV